MAGRMGAVIANLLSAGARALGYFLFYLLRVIYRPRERMMFFAALVPLVAAVVLLVWLF
jgi:hypothetical protein